MVLACWQTKPSDALLLSYPPGTHHNNHTNSRQNITHGPQQIVLTCPSFTLTKTLPLFYRPKLWFTSHKDPICFCCQYSLPRFTCTPLSLPPSPCLTCVCRPAGCLWLSACLPFSVKALGFHTLPASFGECWQVNTGIFTPMSIWKTPQCLQSKCFLFVCCCFLLEL